MSERYNLMRLGKHLGLSWPEMRQLRWREATLLARIASAAMKPKKKEGGADGKLRASS